MREKGEGRGVRSGKRRRRGGEKVKGRRETRGGRRGGGGTGGEGGPNRSNRVGGKGQDKITELNYALPFYNFSLF